MRPSRPPAPPAAPPKDSAFGPFTLIERLAVGGMAEVFRALEPRSAGESRAIVVKRMLPHIASEPGSARMFEEEANLGSLIEHPNVVRVLGFGEAEGQPYLALELVPGLDLHRLGRRLAAEGRALGMDDALHVACELLAGLHAVHQATGAESQPLGIVHGDVTPSNVLLSIHGDVKLADFGIAEARLRSRFPQAAAAGRTKGKLGYLAPEQVRGAATDRRADVFAAAVVTAELLIGQPLFARGSELSILLAVRDARVDPLLERASTLPEGLLAVLLSGLAREPSDRFANAADFRRALLPFVGDPPSVRRRELGEIVQSAGTEQAGWIDVSTPDDEVTMEPPLENYAVVSKGRRVGPISFAHLVEGVTTGRFAPGDAVTIGGRPPRRLESLAELAGHFPPAPTESESSASDEVNLVGGHVVDALARSAAGRANGVWICERGGDRKEVYLIDGAPEFVSSNIASELLGEFLVARGVLEASELEMALAVLPRFDGRLGDTLAALGLVEPVELFRHIADQVREKLLDLFTWNEGHAHFHDGLGPPSRYFPLGLDPFRVLCDGIERRLERGLEQETFASHASDGLARTRAPAPVGLPAEVEALLRLTRRASPLAELVLALEDPRGRDRNRAYRAMRLALALDLVRWTPTEP